MIKKQHVKSRNVYKVTFELPADHEADEAYLLSDVNGWQPIAFEKGRAGKWKLVHEYEPGSWGPQEADALISPRRWQTT
jgi:hypothetical protein